MPRIWPHATPQHPCPICQKPDWCQFGDRAIKCMRVVSDHACPSGGWYHFYGDTEYRPPNFWQPQKEKKTIDAEKMIQSWCLTTLDFQLIHLGHELGVAMESLRAIGAAYCQEKKAWAFPMHDGDGKIVGIRLRNKQGFKWAVDGSRQGIFLPDERIPVSDTAYLPEGPTDTAAGLSIGLYTIGRPNNQSCADLVKSNLRRLGIRRAVIIADNDGLKKYQGRQARPGIEGAIRFKKELGVPSVLWMPPSPVKDLREFVRSGGTKALIESDVAKKVWSFK